MRWKATDALSFRDFVRNRVVLLFLLWGLNRVFLTASPSRWRGLSGIGVKHTP